MNCLDCQDVLQRRLDGEDVPGSSELDQHLAGCLSCRHTHLAAQSLSEGLRALARPAIAVDFTRRLVAAAVHDRLARQRRTRLRLWVTTGMAAAILLMAWAGQIWLPAHKPDGNGVAVVDVARVPIEEPAAPLAKSVDEAREAVVALTDRLTSQTKNQARWLIAAAPMDVPVANLPALPALDEPLDPAAHTLREAGQGISEGFTTVARNARRAVDYFYKELPILE